ncbi:hypothetical protein CDD83_2848 [Cordyceps sp. RAO-2017]|nr:hypothetical protein CDD83_2848 [Cordyceps sp. RAO-2017]
MGGGMGMGLAGGALGLGAGMLGGAALASAVHEHHEHEEREEQEAYMDGYQDGQDNDFGGGDDFGGDF